MHTKNIVFCRQHVVLACDGNCQKAWGINCRPRLQLGPSDDDDIAYLSDQELCNAPANPGTYEGDHAKPSGPHDMNKWCARECERAVLRDPGEEMNLPDWSQRRFNKPWKHEPTTAGDDAPESTTDCGASGR